MSNPKYAKAKEVEYLMQSTQSLSSTGKPRTHVDALISSTHSLTWSGSQMHIPSAGKHESVTIVTSDGKELILQPGAVTPTLALTAFAASFGSSFPHGWNTGVMNAPEQLINDFLNDSFTDRFGDPPEDSTLTILWSLSVAIYLVGGCGGAFAAGWLANFFGRNRALMVTHVFNIIAAVLFGFCGLASSMEMLILARLIVGFGCGAGSGLVPMYLTEIAPINIRGSMGVLHQFALTMGILVSQIFGLRQILGNELWPILLACTALPSLVSMVILPFMPESPRYLLVNKGDKPGARKALVRFRGTEDVDADFDEMLLEQEQAEREPEWTFSQLLRSKELRMPLILVCSLASCQQLSGINAVFYYSAGIFESSGIPLEMIQYAVLGTGIINVIMTGVSIPLMEKCGRRPLLLWGMVVMVVADVIITISLVLQDTVTVLSYFCTVCVIAFVIGFAMGLGSIPQFITAELFKQGPRPPAMSLAGFFNWLCNFIIAMCFPSMQNALGAYSFIVFIFILLGFGIFFFLKLPETKNKTYDEIFKIFNKDAAEPSNKMPQSLGNTAESERLLCHDSDGHTEMLMSRKNGKAPLPISKLATDGV